MWPTSDFQSIKLQLGDNHLIVHMKVASPSHQPDWIHNTIPLKLIMSDSPSPSFSLCMHSRPTSLLPRSFIVVGFLHDIGFV